MDCIGNATGELFIDLETKSAMSVMKQKKSQVKYLDNKFQEENLNLLQTEKFHSLYIV